MHNKPDTVYHYTSPTGMFSILNNRTLWFTDCEYLNDMGEFEYISKPLGKVFAELMEEGEDVKKVLVELAELLFLFPYDDISIKDFDYNMRNMRNGKFKLKLTHHRYYALCTSVNTDESGMWNYYLKNGAYQGYSLGINREFIESQLSALCKNHDGLNFFEGRIIYDEEEQIKEIRCKLEELVKLDIDAAKEEFREYINKQKAFFKSPAFSHEKEYRFILKAGINFKCLKAGINFKCIDKVLSREFRVGESGIITPYIEWKYSSNEREKLFNQITLAPMMELKLTRESFRRFFSFKEFEEIAIEESSIKMRF